MSILPPALFAAWISKNIYVAQWKMSLVLCLFHLPHMHSFQVQNRTLNMHTPEIITVSVFSKIYRSEALSAFRTHLRIGMALPILSALHPCQESPDSDFRML